MRRMFLLMSLAGVFASLTTADRGNYLRHMDRDGQQEDMLLSGGSCRHHLKAHDGDLLAQPGGWTNDPGACN